jgi:hypothetical protein
MGSSTRRIQCSLFFIVKFRILIVEYVLGLSLSPKKMGDGMTGNGIIA